jgi:competence protein ComGC
MLIKKRLTNEQGFVLPLVLLVMVVLSVLFVSMFTLTETNTNQVVVQENNLRGYYMARSGIEIAHAALMTKDGDDSKYNLKIDRFIEEVEDGTVTSLTDILSLPENDPMSDVEIEVTVVDDEVKIHAISTLRSNDAKHDLSLFINMNNYNDTRWSNQ